MMGLPERLAEKWTGAYWHNETCTVYSITDVVREAVREALDEAATVAGESILAQREHSSNAGNGMGCVYALPDGPRRRRRD